MKNIIKGTMIFIVLFIFSNLNVIASYNKPPTPNGLRPSILNAANSILDTVYNKKDNKTRFPTTESYIAYINKVNLALNKLKNNFNSRDKRYIIVTYISSGLTNIKSSVQNTTLKGTCGDGICGSIEKEKGVCSEDCKVTTSTLTTTTGNNTFDAEGFMWGTEVYPNYLEKTEDILTNDLKIDNFKVRIQSNFFSKNGDTYSSKLCMPSISNCKVTYDFDDTVQYFKENNWSMIPMLSFDTTKTTVTSKDIDDYGDFVEWFVSRYKLDANIKYIELTNDPNKYWKGTNTQLIELNNETYEKIKENNPSLNVCTVGLEFWADSESTDKGITTLEYFLDKSNNAKFDCLAFHGYPLININDVKSGNPYFYPPTKKALSNKYAGVAGILEVRKTLDANGWNDRLLIDTEHIGTMSNTKKSISDEEYELDAAYIAQELTLKRTLRNNSSFALSGIIPLKTGPRGIGDLAYGSLKSDSSITPTVTAVSILWDKLNVYNWDSHINGQFDDEKQVWIEKFKSDNKELYIFFKPFEYKEGEALSIDNDSINYILNLSKTPSSIKLTQINGTSENITLSQSITIKSINAPQYLEISY